MTRWRIVDRSRRIDKVILHFITENVFYVAWTYIRTEYRLVQRTDSHQPNSRESCVILIILKIIAHLKHAN